MKELMKSDVSMPRLDRATKRPWLERGAIALTLVLISAGFWIHGVLVCAAGAVGVWAGYKVNQVFKTGNPLRDIKPVLFCARSLADMAMSCVSLAIAMYLLVQGIAMRGDSTMTPVLLLSLANGFFTFSVSYCGLSFIRREDARHEIKNATFLESQGWKQDISARKATGMGWV
ncbi:hypothetical protein [Roseobacter sp.]|uniref:hypothetical protein n=1 Tax=Roseobacter sp. TaxID=1907202 RepID=UPI003299BE24